MITRRPLSPEARRAAASVLVGIALLMAGCTELARNSSGAADGGPAGGNPSTGDAGTGGNPSTGGGVRTGSTPSTGGGVSSGGSVSSSGGVSSGGAPSTGGTGTEGRMGDGSTRDPCEAVSCQANASCVVTAGSTECACNNGYVADGDACRLDECQRQGATMECGEHAECIDQSPALGDAVCICVTSFDTCDDSDPCGIDLSSDAVHCGRCGFACAGSLSCEDGECRAAAEMLRLGQRNTCALSLAEESAAYSLSCTGDNAKFQLRDPDAGAARGTMAAIPGFSRARDIAMSYYTTCVIPEDGDEVACWGGITTTTTFPVERFALLNVQSLEAGRFSFCAITDTHNLYCWGLNEKGQVGPSPGMPYTVLAPRFVDLISDVREVEIAAHSTCALDGDGRVECWGTIGTTYDVGTVLDGDSALVAKRIAGGGIEEADGYCAIRPDDSVACWGANIGHRAGDTGAELAAVAVGVQGAVDISLGAHGACAILGGGGITCWGRAGFDANGTVAGPYSLAYPSGHGQPVDIEMQNNHACARFEDGQVLCRGSNDQGQLGIGAVTSQWHGWTAVAGYP